MSSPYTTGTVSVTNGSTTVTGSGTGWEVGLVLGGLFSAGGTSIPISSVGDDTTLTLAYAWPGSTASGLGYAISRQDAEARKAAWANDRLAEIIARWSVVGIAPNGAGALADRPATPADGYIYAVIEAGEPVYLCQYRDAAWVDATSFQEDSGSNFTFSGSGAPSGILGVNGDTYLNIANGDTYAKSGGSWSLAGSVSGSDGSNGAPVGVLLAYSTTTADADPGAGVFRLNHATIASATSAYVDNVDQDGASIAGYLDTFDDSTNTVRGHLVLRGVTSPSAWAIFSVTGSVVNGTGYRKLTLAYVGSGGTFTNNDVFALSFSRAGDAGAGAVSSVNGATGTVVLYSKDVTPGAWQDVASASTVNLSASAAFRYRITGTTTITALTLGNDKMAVLRFAGALTLTHNATSLILPTGANITTAADDTAWITSDASGNISVISYHRATGRPLGLDAATTAARGGVTLGSEVREKLAANRNYYVRTDGSDSNTGLANTSGGAFLTIQKAIDVILGSLDLNIYDVSVNIASGTYSGAISVAAPVVGSGRIILNGDTTTPSNVSLTGGISVVGGGSRLEIQGLKISSSSSSGTVAARNGGYLKITGKCEHGGATSGHRILADGGGIVVSTAPEVISGTASGSHYAALVNGYIYCTGATWTASGTAAQASFAQASTNGNISAYSNTSSGTFTGARYSATLNGVVQTYGGGASYFPGNSAGSTATGGQYA